ncbi:MAG: LPXTG cell wall anchor domain-containing protein [Aequorivita sp.]
MKYFYILLFLRFNFHLPKFHNLKARKSRDKVLHLTKVQYLEKVSEVKFIHPYYWTGFVVSGDVPPLTTGLNFWWYVGIALLLLLGLFLYLKKKKYL